MSKYIITKDNATVRIQGGINAANGVNAVFMVESVMAVVKPGKIRRERNSSSGSGNKRDGENALFSEIMNSAVQAQTEAPTQYTATVYGRDMKLSSMQYKTREYHY